MNATRQSKCWLRYIPIHWGRSAGALIGEVVERKGVRLAGLYGVNEP
ncbi:hypothetical protein ACNKHL_16560 [Shigella flexneri]